MARNLVIVESPAKVKTIKKFLGPNYVVAASNGHVRDLPKSQLGIDVEHGFEPKYITIRGKGELLAGLRREVKKADKIYLATDPDREGEAISWHLYHTLKLDDKKVYRITFNEITKNAVKASIKNAREIDMDLVDAQQARRMLDRMVGYRISPLLWRKIKRGLSAGRVQSVALRIICDREEEINAFIPEEYWSLDALLVPEGGKRTLTARFYGKEKEKITIQSREQMDGILADLKEKTYQVSEVKNGERTKKAPLPFTTSTLQQEASKQLNFATQKTMRIAQQLYEGIDIKGNGTVGVITYLRTDSTRVSQEAEASAREYIAAQYGEAYVAQATGGSLAGKKIQDAHEAIRPSYIERTPESIKKYLTQEQYKLYKLIWTRFMASQMEACKINNIGVEIDANDYTFRAGSSRIEFDGFLRVYNDEDEKNSPNMPELKEGEELIFKNLISEQHFTQPPARYSEASLVKQLEEYGIGRPSTYAPIITKIQQRGYVEKLDKSLKPTLLGRTVSKQLCEYFKDIMNYEFTAAMELKLDEIAENKADSIKVLKEFYSPFEETVELAKTNMGRVVIQSDKVCPNCGRPMVVKTSRFNKQFLGCSGYPECKTMMSLDGELPTQQAKEEKTDYKCEKCGGETVIKTGPYGKYYQCLNDKCKTRKAIVQSTGVKCPKCEKEGRDGELVQRRSRYGKTFYGCSKYPDCDFAVWNEPTGEKCPDCGELLVKKFLKSGNKIACSSKTCKYSKPMEEAE